MPRYGRSIELTVVKRDGKGVKAELGSAVDQLVASSTGCGPTGRQPYGYEGRLSASLSGIHTIFKSCLSEASASFQGNSESIRKGVCFRRPPGVTKVTLDTVGGRA